VPVECPASGSSCAITAELTAAGGSGGDSRPATVSARRSGKPVVLGRAKVTVPPGHSATVKVRLDSGGRHLLAIHHRLKAHLIVLQRIGGKQTVLRSGTVRFAAHG
jgi:hypothetical protein